LLEHRQGEAVKGFINSISISLYTFFKVRDSLILIFMGIVLLSIGLDGVSKAQQTGTLGQSSQSAAAGEKGEINPDGWDIQGMFAESATPNKAIGAEQSAHRGIADSSPNSFVAEASGFSGFAQQSFNFPIAEGTPFLGAEPLLIPTPVETNEALLGIEDELDPDFDDTLIRNSVANLFRLIEGAFGALLVVGAGIAAIIAGVVGAYKAAFALFVTAIGAFILRAYVSLFFGTDFESFSVGVGGDAAGF